MGKSLVKPDMVYAISLIMAVSAWAQVVCVGQQEMKIDSAAFANRAKTLIPVLRRVIICVLSVGLTGAPDKISGAYFLSFGVLCSSRRACHFSFNFVIKKVGQELV